MEPRAVQSQVQLLALTPQMQQSLQVLQAGLGELETIVEQALEENPALERVERETDETETPLRSEFISPTDGRRARRGLRDGEDDPEREPAAPEQSLMDELLVQLGMHGLPDEERALVSFLIGNLRENGRLDMEIGEISRTTGARRGEVESALRVLQSLEPAGVGARTLEECLLLQLVRQGEGDSLAAALVSRRHGLLLQGKLLEIARAEHVSLAKVRDAVRVLQSLDPYPGQRFGRDEAGYVTPDVLVQEVHGTFRAVTNDAALPAVALSEPYLDMLRGARRGELRSYLKERTRAASWLIQSIAQRQDTLRRVAQCIVELEEDFLREGIESLRPLHLKDVAARAGVHESTVSRAVTGKFIQTPRGVFEMKYFFTSRIETGGGEVSSLLVKEAIRAMIQREDWRRPLSDYAIADALNETDVRIARRTVTKYREALGIPPAPERKAQAQIRGAA